MADNNSPSLDSKQIVGIEPTSVDDTLVQAVPVQSSKGPVGKPTLILNMPEYERIFGLPTTNRERADSAAVNALLLRGQVLLVVRYVNAAATVYASTESPSPDQVVGFSVIGHNVVIENKQLQFQVVLSFATGATVDVTEDPDTVYELSDPEFGTIESGFFSSSGKLGDVVLTVKAQGNVTQFDITVAILRVDYIEIIGPSELVYGVQHQYQAIAHFIDNTTKDVTYAPETQWQQLAGDYEEFVDGLIAGTTISVPTTNRFRVTHKNESVDFDLVINPTEFTLIDAGDSVFGLGTFPVHFSPTYVGNILSHTIEWVTDKPATSTILNSNTLGSAQFAFLANPEISYEVTLYIDRGTVNEQSDSLLITRSALSAAHVSYTGVAGFRDIMAAQNRTGLGNTLDNIEGYIIGPQALELDSSYYPNATMTYAWNPDTEDYDLAWVTSYNIAEFVVLSVTLQERISDQYWVDQSTYTSTSNSIKKEAGFYRLKIKFKPKNYQFPEGTRYSYGGEIELTGTDQTANLGSVSSSSMRSINTDINAYEVRVPKRVSIIETDLYKSHTAVLPSNDDVFNRAVVIAKRKVFTADTRYVSGTSIVTNTKDITNWVVTQLTLT